MDKAFTWDNDKHLKHFPALVDNMARHAEKKKKEKKASEARMREIRDNKLYPEDVDELCAK
jgi:hypothetical protein